MIQESYAYHIECFHCKKLHEAVVSVENGEPKAPIPETLETVVKGATLSWICREHIEEPND
jgi:hypothetical protein